MLGRTRKISTCVPLPSLMQQFCRCRDCRLRYWRGRNEFVSANNCRPTASYELSDWRCRAGTEGIVHICFSKNSFVNEISRKRRDGTEMGRKSSSRMRSSGSNTTFRGWHHAQKLVEGIELNQFD
jgi:hypothetical protein